MNIASVEDDPAQGRLLQEALTSAGHHCTVFPTGKELLTALQRDGAFDLLLVDWELPDINGLDIVRWVRGKMGYTIPVMLVTNRTLEEELVTGLQAGADDYMGKPVRKGELIARTEALLRRHNIEAPSESTFRCGAYEIDPANESITLNGTKADLAPKEYELALLLFRNPGRLFSRDVLSNNVWNREIPATSRTLDTHLSNIRRKLKLRPDNGVRLSSSYALGYRLELMPDATTES
ncbi:response regulator transcription factor [Pollutimonas harenae]|uniref:Response regulator transcription factor n=1 Tax=Pollutimonas harenae TaxID=657015 RepID=A0A853H9F2_9BURK|nr:response regulator transcription factor [Pollutimonas harenae]NYT87053.1 response regulator transcription factor [Pollutimonas harenae]TEA72974.1 response regulator transcription factor [Pollutimonas harenae]